MFHHSTRRWLAGFGVAGALVAVAPAPAQASIPLEIFTWDVLVAPDHAVYNSIIVNGPGEDDPPKTTLDIDFSQVDAIAYVEFAPSDWACVPVGKGLHCEYTADEYGVPSLDYQLTGKPDAKPGTKAKLAVKATNGGRTASADVTVTMAEGVDLRSEPEAELDILPGATAGLPADVVRNAGDNTAHGAVLRLQADYLSPDVGNFSNCEYLDGVATICTFDTDLEPGRSYRLSTRIPVTLDKRARSGSKIENYVDWWTRDDWALVTDNPTFPLPSGKPGTGGKLELVEVRAARQGSVPQTDVDQWNNFTIVNLTVGGDNTADVTADGASVTGKVGDKVEVRVGWTNLGPATVEVWRLTGPFVTVEIPKGTEAVEVSEECAPYDKNDEDSWNPWENGGEPGADHYGCLAAGDPEAGVSGSYPFTLRIDKLDGETSGKVVTDLDGDPNTANDQAALVVKPGAAGSGGGGGGDDGTLPITGQSVALIAGVGGLLVAAGVAGFVVTRRRRTRFTA
ncbi:LPXTG cell wall anchor domain-containing protein [Micromonospora sp. NPDC092111]|uniref:LPXTG cell wall anchor domain-containing protein n=1 Tax=Micromonospora sp. NPDC092111 TaxID=3364289 RepID=UPI00381C423D